jgi:sulfoxide reductase heme-binding subunit YedZ
VARFGHGVLRRIWIAGLLPLAWIVWRALGPGLGVDPVKEIEHRLGLLALQFLLASLCITPLHWLGVNLMRYRRALGLTAFLYATLHLLSWVVFDMDLRWQEITADIFRRPYIIVGMLAFVAMLPLALTSNRAAIRALGAFWPRLHRLGYLALLLAGLHFVILVKAWSLEPLIYMGAALCLLLLRAMRWLALQRRETARKGDVSSDEAGSCQGLE